MTPPNKGSPCPYVGLQPFEEGDREFFFGRKREQRIIASNILAAPLTILYGSSGVGKSSVLMAGVVPNLKARPRTAVVVFRDWQHESFAYELKKACIDAVALSHATDVGIDQSLPLDDLLCQLGEGFGVTLLVIFDQFEDYFFYHPGGPISETFESEFARTVNRDEVDANFVIALREDGLAKLDRFRMRVPNLLGNTLRLQHMDRESAELAIKKPLEVYNERYSMDFSIEDDLVKAVLEQIPAGKLALGSASDSGATEIKGASTQEADERIEAPFLQLVMERLWEEERKNSSVLRLITFQRLGGADEIARTHLERKLNKLGPEDQAVCAEFFDRLVTPSGTKVACRLDDLILWAGNLAGRVRAIVKQLEEGRILRRIDSSSGNKDAQPLYEIFHDILAGAILTWRKQYLKDQEVAEARREAHERQMQAEEKARLAEQEEAEQRRRAEKEARAASRLRWLSRGLGLLLLIVIVLGVTVWRASREVVNAQLEKEVALQNERVATWRGLMELVGHAVNNLDFDPELSLILARHAWSVASASDDKVAREVSKGAADALSRALAISPFRLNFPGSGSRISALVALAYNPEREILVTGSKDGTAKAWDARSAKLIHPRPLPGPTGSLYRLSFNAKGDLLAAGSADRSTYVWDLASGRLLHALPGDNSVVTGVAFSPDGKSIATASSDGTTGIWDTFSGNWYARLITREVRKVSPSVLWVTQLPPPTRIQPQHCLTLRAVNRSTSSRVMKQMFIG